MEGVGPTGLQNLPNLLKMPSRVAGSQPRCPCHANTPALRRVSQRVKKADLLPDEGTVTRRTAAGPQIKSVVLGPSRASNGQRCVLRSWFPFISFWGFQTFFGGLC